jgi:hypothetical protein
MLNFQNLITISLTVSIVITIAKDKGIKSILPSNNIPFPKFLFWYKN